MRKIMVVMLIGAMTIMNHSSNAAANNDPELLAISLIARQEGFRATVYSCSSGVKTIGYGFTDKKLVDKGTITRKEADRELGIIVRKELKFINERLPGLSPKQQAAICSFIYNVGRTAFVKSTFYKKLQEGNFVSAKKELGRWVYARGKVIKGLVNRREREAAWIC